MGRGGLPAAYRPHAGARCEPRRRAHAPGHLAIAQCRAEDAFASARAALTADPLGLSTRTNSLIIALCAHEFEQVIDEADRFIAEHPTFSEAHRWKAMALSMGGDYGAAQCATSAPWS